MAVTYASGEPLSQHLGKLTKTSSLYAHVEPPLLVKTSFTNASKKPVVQRGHSKALPRIDLNQPGRLRIGHLMTYFGVSHSSVYVYIKNGVISPPDGRASGRPYWRTDTIKADLAK